jgi:hypothetical protein
LSDAVFRIGEWALDQFWISTDYLGKIKLEMFWILLDGSDRWGSRVSEKIKS